MLQLLFVFVALACSTLAAPTAELINDQKRIDAINAMPGVLWKAAPSPRFANGETVSSLRSLTGVTPESWNAVQKLPRHVSVIRDADIPDTFDSETNWPQCAAVIGDIRDQSMCGCCWAFGGASAASDRLCISTNGTVAVPLSAQEICFCSSDDGCQGGQIDTPWEYISEEGAVTGGQVDGSYPIGDGGYCSDFTLPHCHHHGPQGNDPFPAEGTTGCENQESPQCPTKCDSNASSAHSGFAADKWTFSGEVQSASGEQSIQKAIMAGGPVETAFTVYTDFANYASGIYHHVSGGVEGGHAVRIVGWGVESGTKYWKVANSWNPYWGEKGYFRIKRGDSECGIEDGVTFSPADATWSQKSSPTPSPGPGPGPSPGPAPTPSTGTCEMQDTEDECDATTSASSGKPCAWCFLQGLGIGICQEAGESC